MRSYIPFLFLLVILKIPVLAMLYLVFWAAREEEVEDAFDEGNDDGGGRRRRPNPRRPIGPRRDPHGGGARRVPAPEPAHEGRKRQPAVVVARSAERSRSADKVRK